MHEFAYSMGIIGFVGALVCFVSLGEPGFALVPIYKLFEDFYYYAVGFPIAGHYAAGAGDGAVPGQFRLTGPLPSSRPPAAAAVAPRNG